MTGKILVFILMFVPLTLFFAYMVLLYKKLIKEWIEEPLVFSVLKKIFVCVIYPILFILVLLVIAILLYSFAL